MTDEIIEAAARAISFLGEGALRSSAAELTRLALELSADDVGVGGVPRDNLKAAAEALSQAGSAGMSEAVLALLDAATNLEKALGVKMDALRGGASELALACREHLKAAEDAEQVRRAVAALEEQERSARPWWWRLLRRKGTVQRRRENGSSTPLLAEEDPPLPDRAEIAVELIREEWRKYVRVDILPRARRLQQLAVDVGVPHQHLASADVAELSTAATELEQEATELLRVLRDPVAQLAGACLRHQQAAEAMEAVQRAAEERAQQRANAAGGVQNQPPCAPAQVDSILFALPGAINLLPYIGRAGVLSDATAYASAYLWWVSLLFSSIWGALGLGLHAQEARFNLVVGFGRLCRNAATLGMTIMVCFFCSWILSPASSMMLTVLCVLFAAAHVALWMMRGQDA